MSLQQQGQKFKPGQFYQDGKLIYEVISVSCNNIEVRIISGNTVWNTGRIINFDKYICRNDIKLPNKEINEIKAELL